VDDISGVVLLDVVALDSNHTTEKSIGIILIVVKEASAFVILDVTSFEIDGASVNVRLFDR
jgi:uncharacterized membrane protein